MTTTTVKSIGSGGGRDYSSVAAWAAACPSNLVTNDEIWRGEVYNDSELTTTAQTDIGSGVTTDATRYIELTAAAGQSFQDHASKLTNPLAYDATKGAAIRKTNNYNAVLNFAASYCRISRLQVKHGSGGSTAITIAGGSSFLARDCIGEGNGTAYGVYWLPDSGSKAINCIGIQKSNYDHSVFRLRYGASAYNCTAVRPSTQTANLGYGFHRNYGSPVAKNCAAFNFAAGSAFAGYSAFSASSGYNCTDDANAPGSNNQVSKTYSGQFENTASDWRAKSGADLINGTRDAANTNDLDIVGQSRSLTTPTIGAWEFVAGGTAQIGVVSETDAALALGRVKARALGSVASSEVARPVTAAKARAVGFASEADQPISVGAGKARAVGFASEAEQSLAIGAAKSRAVGVAPETDAALGFSIAGGTPIGIVTEAGTALAVGRAKARTAFAATETNAALAMARAKAHGLGRVDEIDAAGAFGRLKAKSLGRADELATALAMVAQGGAGARPADVGLTGAVRAAVALAGSARTKAALSGGVRANVTLD